VSAADFILIDGDRPAATSFEDGVERARRAEAEGRPVAMDVAERVAYVGVSAAERARRLSALEAPDFALPDLSGREHRLSEHRGKKVFLIAYASW
jgi:hypothetical protein